VVLEMDYDDHYFGSGIDVQKEEAVKKGIAFFDFDGTITRKDTLLEFIRYCKGSFGFYLGFAINLPFLIGYKLRMISNQSAKEKVLRFFFSGTTVEDFKKNCEDFGRRVVPGLVRPKALEEISRLKAQGVKVVVVSASPENWIIDWANKLELELIASRLETRDGKVTGKIIGKNCHGDEKVVRIREVYDLSNFNVVAAYGDSEGDKAMLGLAQQAYYKPFS
jgi:phosphatidylglycerophosphatase C